jgi:NAD(P)-dependent dehydrogenase (short-subunit alcohol dehydrogenase family)
LLAGRRALVTGGGTALGRSIGRRFLELGASLAICGRRSSALDAAPEAFRTAVLGAQEMLDRTEEDWAQQRARTPAR